MVGLLSLRVLTLNLLLLHLSSSCPNDQPQFINCSEARTLGRFNDLLEMQREMQRVPPGGTVCVNLTSGSKEILTSYFSVPFSFNLRIDGNNSTIKCDSTTTGGDEEADEFVLYVSNSSEVVINQLHFEGCRRSVYLNLVRSIQITSSSFYNFSPRGALEIAHSPDICVYGSEFVNCESYGSGKRKFSGNSGGIAIGYSQLTTQLELSPPSITIAKSTFRDNRAKADNLYQYNVLEVLRDKVYNQRGGGIAFYFGADNYNSHVEITGCTVTGNSAQDSGGGVYMFLGGSNSNHNVQINSSTFADNEALDGGGLEITHANTYSQDNPNNITVTNCMFAMNRGTFGGGYKNIQLDSQTNLNKLLVTNSTFLDNTAVVGAAIYLQSVETVNVAPLLTRIYLNDCTFMNNTGKRGTIFVIGNVIAITGVSHFEGNIGPVLRVLGTLAALEGELSFWNNQHHSEGFSGAIYLSSFGQIILHENVTISFINNTGNEGASIVVKGQLIAAAFTRQLYNPQCFLQYIQPTIPPPQWQVKMTFKGNRASVGPVVLMPDSKICEWNNINFPFFADTVTDAWTFMEMGENYVTCQSDLNCTDVTCKPDPNCVERGRYIQTGVVTLQVTENYTKAYPGESVKIQAVALDQFNHTTSAFIGVETTKESDATIFEPRVVSISPSDNEINFQYSSNKSNTETNTTVTLVPFFTTDRQAATLTLFHESCLPGYVITDNKCSCTETEEVILCQDDKRGLLLADGIWGANPKWSRTLVTYSCPPNYCKCTGDDSPDLNEGCQYLYDEENKICTEKREGLICGKCQQGYGVGLLTSKCREHKKLPEFWIFPIYIVALVVTLVVLVKVGTHLHTILRGFLLYVQLSPIAVAYFPVGYNVRPEFMACISSFFALYVPYDFNFHKEMSSLEAYGLRLIAPIIALIVVPLAARFRQHLFKYWYGIWTIILLMYIMSVETAFSLVFCPVLNFDTGAFPAWFYDGNVRCFTGWHIPLFILALSCIIALFLLILFVAASIYYKTLRKKYVKFEQLERFSIVVTRGIKHEYKWWPIAELGYRYVYVVAVVLAPGFVVVPLVIVSIAFVVQTTIHPYKNRVANYLESLFLLWLVGLLGLGNTTALRNSLTGVNKRPQHLWILLYLPVVFGFILLSVLTVWKTRELIIKNQENFRNFGNFIRTKLVIRRSHRAFSLSRHKKSTLKREECVTNTVVGIEEDVENDDSGNQTYTAYL